MLMYHKVVLLSMAYIGTLSPAKHSVYDLVVLSRANFTYSLQLLEDSTYPSFHKIIVLMNTDIYHDY